MLRLISAKMEAEPIIKASFVYTCFEVTYSLLEKPSFFTKKVLISPLKYSFTKEVLMLTNLSENTKQMFLKPHSFLYRVATFYFPSKVFAVFSERKEGNFTCSLHPNHVGDKENFPNQDLPVTKVTEMCFQVKLFQNFTETRCVFRALLI